MKWASQKSCYGYMLENKFTIFRKIRIFQKCSNMAANNNIFQSGDKVLDNKISQWLEWDNKQAKSYAIVQDLVAQSKWQDLHRMMMTRLKFGTAGIRGKMDIGWV